MMAAAAVWFLLQLHPAQAENMSWSGIGTPRRPAREIVSRDSGVTDKVLDTTALRACPGEYRFGDDTGLATRYEPKRWRSMLSCMDLSTVRVEVSDKRAKSSATVGSLPNIRANLAATIETRSDAGDISRVQQVEPAIILASGGRAVRSGSRLTLHFSNNASRAYKNRGDCDTLEGQCRRFLLLAFVGPENFFLVRKQSYEGFGCLIVDARTGRETELPDIPYLSPDGDRLMVVAGTDGGGGYWPLQIWRRRGDTAFAEWKQNEAPPGSPVAISAVRWIRDDRIDFTEIAESRVQPPPPGFAPSRWSATLNLTGRGWSIMRIAEGR
jgi:hypothetical protein